MFSSNQSNAAAAAAVNYIEDVFSTYLYTGNGSTQTITNGIDLSTKGGLVWIKSRTDTSGGATSHALVDTVRGSSKWLSSNATSGEATNANLVTGFTTSGFSVGNTAYFANENTIPYASWTFREQFKFFDVVTYTGTGSNRNIAHSLGSVPACIMVKRTDTTGDWQVYHRSLANTEYLVLNSTAAKATGATRWNSTTPTSTEFSLGTDASVNASGGTYVAYIFAHDAGGFGLTGTDNVISCGSFTTDGSGNATVDLGYEPQWVLRKSSSNAGYPWYIMDNMRGYSTPGGSTSYLSPNDATAEVSYVNLDGITSTGFKVIGQAAGVAFIYIAIRRGPMKVPTTGTSVFSPTTYTEIVATGYNLSSGFVTDAVFQARINSTGFYFTPRLTNEYLTPTQTAAGSPNDLFWDRSNGIGINFFFNNTAPATDIVEQFGRAPSFFDVVCYTGTGSNTTITHNLGAVPELIIVKRRNATGAWDSYCSALANTEYIVLDTTAAKATGATRWNSTTPTSSVFSVGTSATTNASAGTYVAYLFATCAGVSKVGSYTGTGALQTVNCGFASSARFILIKRTDSTGDWYLWDSARGITSGNDPYILLNVAAGEVTGTNYVDTDSTGFKVTAAAPAALNASGGTYIFLAIA